MRNQAGFESAIAKGTLQTPPPTLPTKQNCHNGSEPLALIVMPKTGMNMVNPPTATTDLNRNINLNLVDFRAEEVKKPTATQSKKLSQSSRGTHEREKPLGHHPN
jgi:hypothetical protein